MFEESTQNGFYVPRTRGRLKCVMIQATSDGTLLTLDAANSEAGVSIGGTTGDYTIAGLPKGDFGHWVGGMVQLAEATGVGSTVNPETLVSTAGTASFETSTATAPGTAAAPANGSRVFLTLFIGRTG